MSSMKRILITGAANGIGRHMASHFLSRGYYVTLADSDSQSLQTLRAILAHQASIPPETLESHALFQYCDVANEASVSDLVGKSIEKFKGIDALINNAGISSPWIGQDPNIPFDAVPAEHFTRFLHVNLVGTYLLCHYAAKHLRASRGCIVNIASTRALMSEPNNEGYAASKAGLLGLTRSLAVSLGKDGVRVNAVSPGWIDTKDLQTKEVTDVLRANGNVKDIPAPPELSEEDHKQHPAGRVGTSEDVAKMVRFLVEDSEGFITGQNFVVDGGMTIKMIYKED
ncbi:hypothetical protein SpCBS45565_g01017 [Spizellomyces sp. 'palustris']|nr:hypothetical protein SpCBS45565_g01017 [Spizellomyces sp. 'palustris']